MFTLSNTIKIYIPSTTNIDGEGTQLQTQFLNSAIEKFSQLFGGATVFDTVGGWYSTELNKVVTESVKIVQSFTSPESLETNKQAIFEFAELIKTEMNQEAVSVEIDGVLYLYS